jgi:cellulose 1,4-beta-cellobiosidase
MTVDTNSKMTVVTQFLKGSDGNLSEIKRFYVQNGKVIENANSTIANVPGNSITPAYCKAQRAAFGGEDSFNEKGGFAQFSKAVSGQMVLVMSLWDDHYANMLWLDSTYPLDAAADTLGTARGTCATTSGVPKDIESSQANNQVTYCESLAGRVLS